MVVVSLIWGANFTAIKFGLESIPAVAFAALRFVIASLVLWMMTVGRPKAPITMATRLKLLGLGVIGNTLYQLAFTIGLITATAVNAALILAMIPTLVALMSAVLGDERITARLWIGLLVATAGVTMVIIASGDQAGAATLEGDGLIVASALCWAIFTVGVRRAGRSLDPLRVTTLTTFGGTPGLVFAAIPGGLAVQWTTVPTLGWASLLYSGLLSIVVAYLLWHRAVQGLGSTRTALYNCLVPVVAAAVAWPLLGERPGLIQLIGGALVFAGIYLTRRREVPAPEVAPAPVTDR